GVLARGHSRARRLFDRAGPAPRVLGRLGRTTAVTILKHVRSAKKVRDDRSRWDFHGDTGRAMRGERSEAHMTTTNDAKSKGTILIADHDFGDVNIERGIIEGAGFRLVAEQCTSE